MMASWCLYGEHGAGSRCSLLLADTALMFAFDEENDSCGSADEQ